MTFEFIGWLTIKIHEISAPQNEMDSRYFMKYSGFFYWGQLECGAWLLHCLYKLSLNFKDLLRNKMTYSLDTLYVTMKNLPRTKMLTILLQVPKRTSQLAHYKNYEINYSWLLTEHKMRCFTEGYTTCEVPLQNLLYSWTDREKTLPSADQVSLITHAIEKTQERKYLRNVFITCLMEDLKEVETSLCSEKVPWWQFTGKAMSKVEKKM